MSWQVQEAKQRFSEVLRAVRSEGPQTITRHGQEVAVILDIADYRRLVAPKPDITQLLLGPPYMDDDLTVVFDEVEAARRSDLPRDLEFGVDG